jgi:hypothetical protein
MLRASEAEVEAEDGKAAGKAAGKAIGKAEAKAEGNTGGWKVDYEPMQLLLDAGLHDLCFARR